jgi:hypothetical protein
VAALTKKWTPVSEQLATLRAAWGGPGRCELTAVLGDCTVVVPRTAAQVVERVGLLDRPREIACCPQHASDPSPVVVVGLLGVVVRQPQKRLELLGCEPGAGGPPQSACCPR